MAMIQPEAGGGVSRPTSNPHAESVQAHLAAALGKPVWILSRFDNCWRWLLDRSDSPWYPTVRCIARSDTATGMLSCKESPQICTNSSPEYMLHVR